MQGRLNNSKCVEACSKWQALLHEAFSRPRTTAAKQQTAEQSIRRRLKGKQGRQQGNSSSSCREVGTSTSHRHKTPYVEKQFTLKNIKWMVKRHQEQGTSDINFSTMDIKDFLIMVPDQANFLSGFKGSAQDVGNLTGQSPLMALCSLHMLLPLLPNTQIYNDKLATMRAQIKAQHRAHHLAKLTDPNNHPALISTILEHKDKYNGIPPSLRLLAKEFFPDRSQECKLAQPRVPQEHNTVAAAATAKDKPVGKEPEPGMTKSWFQTSSSKRVTKCKCSGNCRPECPARYRNQHCPNWAVINLSPQKTNRLPGQHFVPLCDACRCQAPGCQASARKPWGTKLCIGNYGFCTRHQTHSTEASGEKDSMDLD